MWEQVERQRKKEEVSHLLLKQEQARNQPCTFHAPHHTHEMQLCKEKDLTQWVKR